MRLRKTKTIRYKEGDEVKTSRVPQMNGTGREMQAPALSHHQRFTLPFKHPQIQWMDEVMKKRDCDVIRILNRVRPDMTEAAVAKVLREGADRATVIMQASMAYDEAEAMLEKYQEWAKSLSPERVKRIKTEYEAWIEFKLSMR